MNTLDRFNVGKHTLEDQMDLMNTHLLTSWVWRTHTLVDQMDFEEIHMTTSWMWGIHTLPQFPHQENSPSVEDGRKQKQTLIPNIFFPFLSLAINCLYSNIIG